MNQAAESSPIPVAPTTDQALRTSELSYRRLFETAQDGILILDAETGRVNDVNPFLIKLLGFSHDEMVGRTVGELSPFKDLVSNKAMLELLQKDRFVRYHDLPLETKAGRKVDVEFVSNVYQVGDQQVIQCNIREITDRKRAEEALRTSQLMLGEIINALPARVFWKDKNLVYLGCNTVFARDAGFADPKDMIGKNDTAMVWREQAEAYRRDDRQVIESGRPKLLIEESQTTPAGKTITLLSSKLPLRDARGEIIGMLGTYIDISARKQAQEALRASEEQFRAMFELASIGMAQADPRTGQWLRVNQKMCDITGYPAGEMLQLRVSELTHPDDRQKDWAAFQQVARGEMPDYRLEKRYLRKDGTVVWVNVNMTVVRDAAGQPVRTMATIEDITERRRAEAALRQSEERYKALFERSLDCVFLTDLDGKFMDANQPSLDLLGYQLEDIPTLTFASLLTEDQLPLAFQTTEEIKATGHQERLTEFRLRGKDGRLVHVETQASLIYREGRPFAIQGVARDLTERKRAEQSQARLAMAVEQATESVVITGLDARILYANPAFEKSTGYTRAEALGQNPRLLKSGKQDAEFYSRMWAVLKRGEVWHGHFINRRKDGTLYEEEATISPVRDAAGTVVNYVAVKRDVTREVQLEMQFRQAQKMEAVGQLAGGVAHDFNNILAVIQMQASLLKSDGLSTEQTELADGITESVQRAVALTRQLLLFSRREVFQPRDLELNETIAATTKMLKRMLGETIEMQLKLAAQPLFLHADAGMLDQVLMNLCVNARDAMPGGGHLLIETAGVELDELAVGQSVQARAGSFVRLSVSDNGGGIPPEILPKIFEPFFTTKPVGKGTGLGLATVFGIVQQHQGWINAYSEVGHGTAFRIYLPRLAGNVLLKSASPVLAAMRGGHETILLAEDDPALRVAVRKALAQLGYRILEAPTGVKALAVWQENRNEISLLLTDLVMPDGMTGKALAQRLLQENPKLKVIYMSGYSAEVVGKDFPMLEDVNFLTKPFPAQKLAQTIRNCLDARR